MRIYQTSADAEQTIAAADRVPARVAADRMTRAVVVRAVPGPRVRVLGLDPGSRITGYGVVDCDAHQPRYIASGSIRTAEGEFAGRLQEIFRGIAALVDEYQPTEIAIERVFVHRNPDSALKLGQARGAALCATFATTAPVHEYTPREVKLAVAGTGAADKEQVQRMVKSLLSLQGRLGADAADALAIALCHAHGRAARLAFATASRRR